jgi:hypothetical protein
MDFLNVVRCCTPALPSAYADALSYYDALCKLQGAINECINILNGYLNEVDKKIAEAILSENICNIIERLQAVYIPDLEAINFGAFSHLKRASAMLSNRIVYSLYVTLFKARESKN